jgi:hypothetical protein
MERQGHPEHEDGDWFAEHLGEGWRTSGDGIYHFVEDTDQDESSDASEPLWREQQHTGDGKSARLSRRSATPPARSPQPQGTLKSRRSDPGSAE